MLYCVLWQAEDEAEKFMKEEPTFLEYEKQVYKYHELVSELQYEVEKVCIHICWIFLGNRHV